MKRISDKIKTFLFIVSLLLVWASQVNCVGYTKQYQWEPTEREKEEIIERAAEKMAEEQLKEAEK